MERYTKPVCAALLIFLLCSCGSKAVPPPSPSDWRYEKDAIRLNLKVDPQLNLYNGMPHTLVLCVCQLKDPNAFNQLTEDLDGLHKLLECGRFDASVVSSKQFIIHPGEDVNTALDRAEGARYVAIVAGYYRLQKEGMVQLYEIPWYVEKKGFIRKTKQAKPGSLDINLVLGSQLIESFQGEVI
jgi:type VI secretion system VasD/TssJ family lipoprotein